ncbi:MAG: hypothetical protein WA786_07375 [Acidimicrobiales bacterium]
MWARTLSPEYGTIVWTSTWEDLTAREAATAALVSDSDYLSLLEEGEKFLSSGIDDNLYEIVYPGANPTTDAKYVGTVRSACKNGHVIRGIATGVEIAQRAEAVSGNSTAFTANATGQWGGVVWITGYDSLAAFETAQKKLNADMDWLQFVDGATSCYSEEASVTQSVLYARLS